VTNAFGGRARPDLLGEIQRSPRSIAAIGGGYLLLREREETGKKREGRGGIGNGGEGLRKGRAREREGQGKGDRKVRVRGGDCLLFI